MPEYSLINSKMLSVRLRNEEVFAKRGAMIAYTGFVDFAPSSSGSEGMRGAAMRSVTGERMTLMSARGTGEVLYAYYGMHVTMIPLRGETFYAESESVLAYDGRLRSGTEFMGQGGVGGLVPVGRHLQNSERRPGASQPRTGQLEPGPVLVQGEGRQQQRARRRPVGHQAAVRPGRVAGRTHDEAPQ